MRILYATDGSTDALAGAELLACLPLETDWELVVLTVLVESDPGDGAPALAPALEALRHTPAQITTDVRHGAAAEEILRVAEEHPADLIVVGCRGLSGIARFFLGSVAERVARHASCPVLVARPLRNEIKRVVIGVDGSVFGTRAVEWVQRFPFPPESAFELTTVLPPRQAAIHSGDLVWPTLIPELDKLYEQERRAAQERLDMLVAAFDGAGKRASARIEMGDPAHSLIEVSEEQSADLIVVGSQGLSGIDRFLLGSVSEKVMHYAHCSVLVVK
jgi:nucleotide-binding universal stress UspA family protein